MIAARLLDLGKAALVCVFVLACSVGFICAFGWFAQHL